MLTQEEQEAYVLLMQEAPIKPLEIMLNMVSPVMDAVRTVGDTDPIYEKPYEPLGSPEMEQARGFIIDASHLGLLAGFVLAQHFNGTLEGPHGAEVYMQAEELFYKHLQRGVSLGLSYGYVRNQRKN